MPVCFKSSLAMPASFRSKELCAALVLTMSAWPHRLGPEKLGRASARNEAQAKPLTMAH